RKGENAKYRRMEPPMNTDETDDPDFAICVHRRPSAVPFLSGSRFRTFALSRSQTVGRLCRKQGGARRGRGEWWRGSDGCNIDLTFGKYGGNKPRLHWVRPFGRSVVSA